MLTADEIFYNLKNEKIIQDVSFSLQPGERVALLGPNGAGKTTLLKLAAGLKKPDRGRVLWKDQDMLVAQPRIGYLSHDIQLYEDLTACQNLKFFCRLHGLQRDREEILQWLKRVNLLLYADSRVEKLSRGMKQRLALCRCFFIEPEVILLDEPFSGLDLSSVENLLDMMEEFSSCPFMFASHDIDRALQHCHRWLLIEKGSFSERGSPTEGSKLRRLFPGNFKEKIEQ